MKIAFPTDEHHPYTDPRARSVALQVVRDFKPDVMVSGSDAIDFYSVSRYDKNPGRVANGLQAEIDAFMMSQLEWLDAAPKAKFFYIKGNHEDRLRRYLWRHPEIFGLEALDLPNLLDLDGLGIIHEDYNDDRITYRSMREIEIDNRLVIRHGDIVRKHSGYTARGELEREFYKRVVLTGHTHRGGVHYATTRDGVVMAVECFCLCDLQPEYVAGTPNWQQGIVLATVRDGMISLEQVVIQEIGAKKGAIWREKVYWEE